MRRINLLAVLFGVSLAPSSQALAVPKDRELYAREQWLSHTLNIIESTVSTLPTSRFGVDEYRCLLAERQFGKNTIDSRPPDTDPDGLMKYLRQRWSEDVIFLYCLGEAFDENDDPQRHDDLRSEHRDLRFEIRPHHRLEGAPNSNQPGKRADFMPADGQWQADETLQELRRKTVSHFVARDELLIHLVYGDRKMLEGVNFPPNLRTGMYAVRFRLRDSDAFGFPMFPEQNDLGAAVFPDWVDNNTYLDHVMRFLVGVADEGRLYGDAKIPAPDRYDPIDLARLREAGVVKGRLPYRKVFNEDKYDSGYGELSGCPAWKMRRLMEQSVGQYHGTDGKK